MSDMPICRPEQPRFGSGAERQVWDRLKVQLGPDDVLLAGIRVSDRAKDHEADLVVLMPGGGIVVVEVKGGSVWRAQGEWLQARAGGAGKRIDPVEQARGCRYALRAYVESDSRWYANRRRRVRWAHAVVLPTARCRRTSRCRTARGGWSPTAATSVDLQGSCTK